MPPRSEEIANLLSRSDLDELLDRFSKLPDDQWPGLYQLGTAPLPPKKPRWPFSEWITLAWCVLLLLATCTALTWELVPWTAIVNHQTAAAWVQAFGTIVALAVAIGVAGIQNRHARALEAERELRATQSRAYQARAILTGAREAALPAIVYVRIALGTSEPAAMPFQKSDLEGAIAVVRQALVLPLPALGVSLLMSAHGYLSKLLDLVGRCGNGKQVGDKYIAFMLKDCEIGLENASRTMDTMVASLLSKGTAR